MQQRLQTPLWMHASSNSSFEFAGESDNHATLPCDWKPSQRSRHSKLLTIIVSSFDRLNPQPWYVCDTRDHSSSEQSFFDTNVLAFSHTPTSSGERKRKKDGLGQHVPAHVATQWLPRDQHDLPASAILALPIERHQGHRVWVHRIGSDRRRSVAHAAKHGCAGKRSAAERSHTVRLCRICVTHESIKGLTLTSLFLASPSADTCSTSST